MYPQEPCGATQAEIENDTPYRSHNRNAMEEHDRAMDNLRIERREFIESMIKIGYARCGGVRDRKTYFLNEAIEMIVDQEFWNTVIPFDIYNDGVMHDLSIEDIVFFTSDNSFLMELYFDGKLLPWHAEIHKQVVLLADMALGEV